MNQRSKCPGQKWWMGWASFFRVLSGAAILSLICFLVSLEHQTDADNFTASDFGPPVIIIKGVGTFGGLLVLAFLVFWIRRALIWLFIWIWRLLRWLFRWRMVRRYLYGIAGVAFFVGLFYAEEDWRGKRDWEQYKRGAEMRGEKFDLSSFESTNVPDDQNFMFAPIISNSCLSRIDGAVPEHPKANTNRGHRLDVKINANYEWKPWPTNDFQGNWQLGKKIDLKAFQAYYRAPVNPNWRADQYPVSSRYRRRGEPTGRYGVLRLAPIPQQAATNKFPDATNEFPVAPQAQSPVADVLLALSKYDSAIEEVRQASRRPFFQFPLQHHPDATKGFINLAPLKECMDVLRLRAVAELENDQSEKALADITLMLFLANPNPVEPWRQSWRINSIDSALQPVWQGLMGHKWSDSQLIEIGSELAKFDFLSDYQHYVRGWRAEIIQTVDSIEQERFHEFWAQLYFGPDQDNRSLFQRIFNGDTLLTFMPRGWFYENDVAVAQMAQESILTDAEVDRRILSAEVTERCDKAMANNYKHKSVRNFATSLIYTGFRTEQNCAFTQSSLDRARLACALERHRLAEGGYPATLDALTPRFIKHLPSDIINGQPFHYQRTADGRFLLYSVGWNGRDDAGTVVRRKDRIYATLDKNQGDWVWPTFTDP